MTLLMLDPKGIKTEDNIRFDNGDLSQLQASIDRNGVLVPILVRAGKDGWILVAGHRRRQAALNLGIDVPAYDQSAFDWDKATVIEAQYAENVFREDLTPVEKAQAVLDLQEVGLNQRDIAAATGIAQRKVGAWQKLGRADLSEVDGASDLNEQQLLELAGEVDEDYIGPVVTRFLNETHSGGGQRFNDLDHAYQAEQQGREKEEQWAKIRPLLDELAETGIKIEEGYVNQEGRHITDARSKDASHHAELYGYIVLDLKAHRSEPCHRVYIQDNYNGVVVVENCAQPKRHTKEGATVEVPDAKKIRKAQTKAATERKVEREEKTKNNAAYGEYLRTGNISKADQFTVAVDATERAFHYDHERDVVRWLALELVDPPEGSFRNKWQHTVDTYLEGMSATKRAAYVTKIRVIRRHVEGAWRYNDDDRTTELSVETFGKDS